MDLKGKVAIVTGSGLGLGFAYAKELASAGARVVVNDIDADTAETAAKQILAAGLGAASDAAAGITGQCVGIGGDRLSLWSHPQQVAAAYADGGWSADAIDEAWPTTFGAQPQTVGEQLPDPAN